MPATKAASAGEGRQPQGLGLQAGGARAVAHGTPRNAGRGGAHAALRPRPSRAPRPSRRPAQPATVKAARPEPAERRDQPSAAGRGAGQVARSVRPGAHPDHRAGAAGTRQRRSRVRGPRRGPAARARRATRPCRARRRAAGGHRAAAARSRPAAPGARTATPPPGPPCRAPPPTAAGWRRASPAAPSRASAVSRRSSISPLRATAGQWMRLPACPRGRGAGRRGRARRPSRPSGRAAPRGRRRRGPRRHPPPRRRPPPARARPAAAPAAPWCSPRLIIAHGQPQRVGDRERAGLDHPLAPAREAHVDPHLGRRGGAQRQWLGEQRVAQLASGRRQQARRSSSRSG